MSKKVAYTQKQVPKKSKKKLKSAPKATFSREDVFDIKAARKAMKEGGSVAWKKISARLKLS